MAAAFEEVFVNANVFETEDPGPNISQQILYWIQWLGGLSGNS